MFFFLFFSLLPSLGADYIRMYITNFEDGNEIEKEKKERQRGKKLEEKNDCCFSTMIKKIFDIYNSISSR